MEDQNQVKGQLFENLRSLINIVDQLRDVGVQDYIKLPRIAVLGTQSAGKSSLLENIVGLDFLPRGSGVVTRRPLEMRLQHKPEAIKPWAYFGENKEKRYEDFEKVREEIERQTDEVAGNNKGFSEKPITLTIYSADCPDLTMIDLPGITRIPIKGTQQENMNVEAITKDMARSFCSDERTIILCVMPANQDLSTSDGLQMARELDPHGKRTLGVLTKIDIMDRGTDARKILLNQEIELKLGYVAVRNRSQQDINNKVRVGKALKDEEQYFANSIYSTLPQDCLGTKALVGKLTTILFKHIREYLPQIIKEIELKIRDCEEKLKTLGPSLPKDHKERMHLVWNMLTDYTENFKNQIRGKYDVKISIQAGQDISGGAKIKMMLNDLYSEFVKIKATKDYSEEYIIKAITLHQGDSIPGFPSFDSFLYLIMPQLEKLKEPALDILNEIATYMESMSNGILRRVFSRFPQILEEISEISSRVLQEQRDKAKAVVENVIDSELGYIFTNDEGYLTSKASLVVQKKEEPAAPADDKIAPQSSRQQPSKPEEKLQNHKHQDPNKHLANELRSRVDAYYSLVVRNLRDQIPKAIGFFLVRATEEQMQYQLYSEIMKNQHVMSLLDEPEYIAQERETITTTLKVLKNAQKVLRKDTDATLQKDSKLQQFTNTVVNKVKDIFK